MSTAQSTEYFVAVDTVATVPESLETSPFLLFVLNDQIIESEMNQHISLIFQERILSTLSFKERSG